jgi:hypothetical protein
MKKKIDFKKEPLGPYTGEQVKKAWGNLPIVLTEDTASIVKNNGKKVLQLDFFKGKWGKRNKVSWRLNLKKGREVLYLQYKIKFEKGFDFRRGGKLPGIGGGDQPGGGRHSNKGFSSRIMWREGGDMHQYVYYPEDGSKYGKGFWWEDLGSEQMKHFKFQPGKWHTIKMKIQMNKFKWRGNGYITSWLDGRLALRQDVKLRMKGEGSYGADSIMFTVFFGGADRSWAPRKDCKIYFDEFIISDKEIK